MDNEQELASVIGKGLSTVLPAGHKAATTADIYVRGTELCTVLALSPKQGIAVMLALAVVIITVEYAIHKWISPNCQSERQNGRNRHTCALQRFRSASPPVSRKTGLLARQLRRRYRCLGFDARRS
jgi:hypothetical protein